VTACGDRLPVIAAVSRQAMAAATSRRAAARTRCRTTSPRRCGCPQLAYSREAAPRLNRLAGFVQ